MKTYVQPQQELPVYGTYDVLVAGGGCAGLTAAIAAARNGAKTIILERFPYFGGTLTASLMTNIVGFRNQVKPDDIQTTRGIGEEIILRLLKQGGAVKSPNAYPSQQRSDRPGDLSYNYAIDSEQFKHLALEMVTQADVKVLFHTWLSDVVKTGNTLKGVIVENKSGRQVIFAKTVIDATGDGDVAYKAKVPFWQIRKEEGKRLVDGLMYKITGFDPATKANGCLIHDSMVVWGPAADPADATDADDLTRQEIKTRLAVYADLAEKVAENPELKGSRIIDTGSLLGIRQTRFFRADYELTGEDVLKGRTFPDSIAMAANPVIHYYGYRRFLEHTGYDIPYRCLLPQGVENLLLAGRCIGSDQIAFESWRAMAHILAMGEAAGTAAALATDAGMAPRRVSVEKLQAQLIAQGAEIGQSRQKSGAD